MNFEKLLDQQREAFAHSWDHEKREVLRVGWDVAMKESAETAEKTKSPKFTKSWNEACDEIAKEIRKAK